MSPRRSSRARTTQPPPGPPTHTNSSMSSNSLTRGERSTRSNNRGNSPRRSSTQRSESADGADASTRVEPLAPRRSRRGTDKEEDSNTRRPTADDGLDVGEDEVTRCICGHAEYPGPPTSIHDQKAPGDAVPDDLGNFFIQCDNCHVWQHGGCMGLADESMTPDEYFCEQCKPESHKITRGSNGSRHSRYLPVLEARSSRSSSLSSSAEQLNRKDSKGRLSVDESTKRRATMNSRGAYEEAEMVRRAIEESTQMATLGKRPRDEIEEMTNMAKRRRTSSSSPSSLSKRSMSPSEVLETGSRGAANAARTTQSIRGAAAKNHREKEIRDQHKEMLAAQKAEAARKRNARSERRRAEGKHRRRTLFSSFTDGDTDSSPPTPSLSPSKAASVNAGQKSNGNDPSPSHKSNINNLRKKTVARRGRLGRNQYTRDQPLNGDTSDTPMRDNSHDPNGNGLSPPGVHGINGESGRSSKAKTHPARTSMNEMKRRVAAILEFVGRMQTERPASSQHSSGSASKGASTPNGTVFGAHSAASSAANLPTAGLVRAIEAGLKDVNDADGNMEGVIRDEKAFNEMASGEMMETLGKELVGWQSVYGKYGEK